MTITCLISASILIPDVLMTSSSGISSIQRRQISELQLLRSSVSSEEFHWRGTSQEIEQWDQALAASSDGDAEDGVKGDEDDSTSSSSLPPFAAAISLRDKEPALWLDIDLPTSRQHDTQVAVRVQEEDRSRVKDFQLSRLRDEMARKQVESKEEGGQGCMRTHFESLELLLTSYPPTAAAQNTHSSTCIPHCRIISSPIPSTTYLNQKTRHRRPPLLQHSPKTPRQLRSRPSSSHA
jgi:hypothetical protein